MRAVVWRFVVIFGLGAACGSSGGQLLNAGLNTAVGVAASAVRRS